MVPPSKKKCIKNSTIINKGNTTNYTTCQNETNSTTEYAILYFIQNTFHKGHI